MAKGMSWIKTSVKLAVDGSDETVADLITDGCNMGVKSLSKYLNQYKAADEKSKDITKRLINLEERLVIDIRQFYRIKRAPRRLYVKRIKAGKRLCNSI